MGGFETPGPIRSIRFVSKQPDEYAERISLVAPSVSMGSPNSALFASTTRGWRLPRTGIFSTSLTSARVKSSAVRPYCSFTIPTGRAFESLDRGRLAPFDTRSGHILSSEEPFDLRCGGPTRMLVLNVSRALVDSYVRRRQSLGGQSRFDPESRVSLVCPNGATLSRYVTFIWRELESGGVFLHSALATAEMENSLAALFVIAAQPSPKPVDRSPGTSAVQRVTDLIEANLTTPVSPIDLTEAAGCSPRSLRSSFRKRYGVTPRQFLIQRRLEAANRELLAAEEGESTVAKVAMRYGFYHLGRFSQHYQVAFGELPSQTLRR
jgi:AraC-like DNA-binding protein